MEKKRRVYKITEAQYKLLKGLNEEVVVTTTDNFKQGTNITDANRKLNREIQNSGLNIQNNPNVEKRVEINDPSSKTGELEVTIDDKNPNTKQTYESRVVSMKEIREETMRKLKENSELTTLNELISKRK